MSNSKRVNDLKVWFWFRVGAYCRACGYDDCVRALHFHHLNNSKKSSPNDTLAVWLRVSRELVVEKCLESPFTILCANCHAELHDKRWKFPDDYEGEKVFTKADLIRSTNERLLSQILEVNNAKKPQL